MSSIKNYLEDLIYSTDRSEVYILLKEQGWTDEEIDDLYKTYFRE